MEQRVLSAGGKRWLAAGLVAVVVLGSMAAWWSRSRGPALPALDASGQPILTPLEPDTLAMAPRDQRVTVRVLNATGVRGLARRATFYLRSMGYDVVDFDSDRGPTRDSSEVVVHGRDSTLGIRLQRALGVGRVTSASVDSLRYVDLTVVLGRDWQPPADTLRP